MNDLIAGMYMQIMNELCEQKNEFRESDFRVTDVTRTQH